MSRSSNNLSLTIVRSIINENPFRSYIGTPLQVSSYRLFSSIKSNILLPSPYLSSSATSFPPYIVSCRLKSPIMKSSRFRLLLLSLIIMSQTSYSRIYSSYSSVSSPFPMLRMYTNTSSMLRFPCFITITVISLLFIVIYAYSMFRFIHIHNRTLYIWFSLYSVFSFITSKLGLALVI